MKICVAQTRPVKGDIQKNTDNHKKIIDVAISLGADAVFFPELSITGYEPELSKELATDQDDKMFEDFQRTADAERVIIGIGAPVKNEAGISISMILFQPHEARQTYSKKHLHSSEESFFTSGQSSVGLIGDKADIALAICYELFVAEHAETAFKSGAKIYLASVVERFDDADRAVKRLSEIAGKYSMTVLMANCVGRTGIYDCAGKSSVWNDKGSLVGQLDDASEGILIFDTDTEELIKRVM